MTFRYIHVVPQTLHLFTTTKEKSRCNFAGFVEQVDDAVLIRIQRSSVHGLSNRLQQVLVLQCWYFVKFAKLEANVKVTQKGKDNDPRTINEARNQ